METLLIYSITLYRFVLNSQYLYTWQTLGWVVGGGVVMVIVVISVLQGSLTVSILMAVSIVMVVLQASQVEVAGRGGAC